MYVGMYQCMCPFSKGRGGWTTAVPFNMFSRCSILRPHGPQLWSKLAHVQARIRT